MLLILATMLALDPPKTEMKVGQPVPSVDALFADGNPYDPAHLKGKFILMTWWSADDEETRKHFAKLRELRKEFAKEKRLQIVTIQLDGEFDDWLAFQEKQPPLDPKHPTQAFYSDSQWWQAFHHPSTEARRNPFRVGKKPTSFLISPDGKLAAMNVVDSKLREIVVKAIGKK